MAKKRQKADSRRINVIKKALFPAFLPQIAKTASINKLMIKISHQQVWLFKMKGKEMFFQKSVIKKNFRWLMSFQCTKTMLKRKAYLFSGVFPGIKVCKQFISYLNHLEEDLQSTRKNGYA